MSDENPYVFESSAHLLEKCKELGFEYPERDNIVVNISRTPLESIWPSQDVDYGDPPQKYVSVAFGSDVDTPWGPLPKYILLLRKDVADKLRKPSVPKEPPKPPEKKFTLYPPGWKPAPGFTDPRKG